MVDALLLALLALVTAAMGTLGGIGGAVLLVPALILLGVAPADAAPLGLLTVAAGSLSGTASQLESGTVHHRLGVVMELAAAAGAAVGAVLAGLVSAGVLSRALGAAAIVAGLMSGARRGLRNPPDPSYGSEHVGEWWGGLAGAYELKPGRVVPYRASRVGLGLGAIGIAGLVAGLTGTSGGYIKTPVMSEVMRVPVRVAASTTVFMVGITAAAALLVHAIQGRIEVAAAGAVVAGGLLGGRAGTALRHTLSPVLVRRFLGLVLLAIGVLLLVRG